MSRLNIAMAVRSMVFMLFPLRLPPQARPDGALPIGTATAITICGGEQA